MQDKQSKPQFITFKIAMIGEATTPYLNIDAVVKKFTHKDTIILVDNPQTFGQFNEKVNRAAKNYEVPIVMVEGTIVPSSTVDEKVNPLIVATDDGQVVTLIHHHITIDGYNVDDIDNVDVDVDTINQDYNAVWDSDSIRCTQIMYVFSSGHTFKQLATIQSLVKFVRWMGYDILFIDNQKEWIVDEDDEIEDKDEDKDNETFPSHPTMDVDTTYLRPTQIPSPHRTPHRTSHQPHERLTLEQFDDASLEELCDALERIIPVDERVNLYEIIILELIEEIITTTHKEQLESIRQQTQNPSVTPVEITNTRNQYINQQTLDKFKSLIMDELIQP